jgi:hypothetical protein
MKNFQTFNLNESQHSIEFVINDLKHFNALHNHKPMKDIDLQNLIIHIFKHFSYSHYNKMMLDVIKAYLTEIWSKNNTFDTNDFEIIIDEIINIYDKYK